MASHNKTAMELALIGGDASIQTSVPVTARLGLSLPALLDGDISLFSRVYQLV